MTVKTDDRRALLTIAAALPTEDEWVSAADIAEYVANTLDEHEIPRPTKYKESPDE